MAAGDLTFFQSCHHQSRVSDGISIGIKSGGDQATEDDANK
jgi:hypothetical protein